jgi:transposase
MPQNFIEGRREQSFLLPPDVRDWLPEDHLAWFVIEAVASMDLSSFYAAYRADGHGRAAYEPSAMVALILYAFATMQRSARAIERHCRQDVAYRVITGNLVPDHATIARFIVRHEAALADLFGAVLSLCAQAGLVDPELIVVDGTRLQGNSSPEANREYQQLAREILAEAKATDEAEDELYGDARGDELPEQLRTAEGRRAFFEDAKRKREPDQQARQLRSDVSEMASVVRAGGHQGRVGWLREGRRQLEQRRNARPEPIPRFRALRLDMATRRLQEELDTDRRSNELYEHYRAHARDPQGRGLGVAPKPIQLPEEPQGKVNVSDPDSRQIKTNAGFGWVQGYNAQAVVGSGQIVLAAELTNNTNDFSQLDPMVTATLEELQQAGVTKQPRIAMADAGYWRESQIDEVVSNKHIQVLIPPDAGNRAGPRQGWTRGRPAWMRHVLSSASGQGLYRKRKQMIEPVFAHTKHNRGIKQFHRRGLKAVRTEWRLLMATHNLAKLHGHQIATAAA